MSEGWVRYRGAEGGRDTVPRKLAERAREIAAGTLTPAGPRDAATIILLRQGSGVEAYLLRRTGALDFAPGACVFPGGSVDERDADPQIGWAGPPPAEIADPLGTSADRPGPWSARRSGRRSRSPACCWPVPRRRRWWTAAARWPGT